MQLLKSFNLTARFCVRKCNLSFLLVNALFLNFLQPDLAFQNFAGRLFRLEQRNFGS